MIKRLNETQRLWACRDVAAHFFVNDQKATTKFLSNWKHIDDAHKLLWPNVPCPKSVRLASDELPESIQYTQPAAIHTTVVWAAVTGLFVMTSRPQDARAKAAAFLKQLADKACAQGIPLRVPIVRPNGTYVFLEQTATSPTGLQLWDDEMLSEIDGYWMADSGSGKKPWLVSSRARQATLSEYLLFSLDPVPVRGSRGAFKKLKELKNYLRLAALGLVTQLANFYCSEEKINSLTRPMSKRRKAVASGEGKSRRAQRFILWPLIGQGFHRMVDRTAT